MCLCSGSAYTYVIYNVQERLKAIRRQMRRALQESSPGDTSRFDLMMLKHWMYQVQPTAYHVQTCPSPCRAP